ncbi:metallophosphoesterase [Virgibacillus pantothenticus]|uniref:Phosphoesterase n=1 Tax=Virgibacillus pantothenticus TaxID=1473 RepID=A0A0L0QQ16_VIRPA|nr:MULTISPECIES: metallophosphoesterase [Virgibacillus]API90704.1 YfcE family phosphodiesterase [Virgibacillus sp. 6R]KNE20654.1 metallophosphatase [Virgibacillus pantothenticus]MBS7427695.1 metallophosphoesterase [Virgibacillus sp. 19R1-5]MBU8566183.1 metallophosphoesterase [Virgibacillus pantothenticus]MBU8600521.1 metallophosphoesterase [Virgibacillus pantothenticus]
MTKVLIVSDSHGLTTELEMIKQRHYVDAMIHCGDSELGMDDKEMAGFYTVMGNCDVDNRYPEEQTLTVNDLKFLIVHGHLHQVKRNLLHVAYRAEELGAQIICFGHTHIAGAEQQGNQLLINPGSIRLPRGRKEKTYAIMEWDVKEEIRVQFYTVDGEQLKDSSYTASLS